MKIVQGLYISHFDQISVKISVFGSYTLIVAPMWVIFGVEEGTSSTPNFTPSVQRVAPARRKTSKSASE